MLSSDYEKLDNMKPVIALPIAVLGYNAETTSETIEAMLQTAFGMNANDAVVRFLYTAGVLQGEYNSSFQKFYIGDRECLLGGNVVTDGSSISQATLEFSYVDGGKLHTVAITMVVSGESGNETYTYSAKVLESGDDTYYLPDDVRNLDSSKTVAEVFAALGGADGYTALSEAIEAKKKIYLPSIGWYLYSTPVSACVSLTGVILSYNKVSLLSDDITIIVITCYGSEDSTSIKQYYPAGCSLNPKIITLSSSSTSDEISTAVGGESGLKAIIQAVKDGNRLFFKATSENDLVTFVYPYSVIYSVSDNGDMTFALGYCMYAIIGFSNIGFVINYTKSSNTFTCDNMTA